MSVRTFFHPHLVNGILGDPAVWVDLMDRRDALLLDLGDLHPLSSRQLLRVGRALVTHTHLDHFVGFDQLLRVSLGREDELTLVGPAGFIENVTGRLAGYTWNLITSYPIRLRVDEIDGDAIRSVRFSGAGGLGPEPLGSRPFDGRVHEDDELAIDAAIVDHGVPVLAWALRERERLAVDRAALEARGLVPGPWLGELKRAVRRGASRTTPIDGDRAEGGTRRFELGPLADALLRRVPGQELAYVTDVRHDARNVGRLVELVRGVSLLICETAFLHADAGLARERNHLTARQAGELARAARVTRLAPFHVSPRYEGREPELFDEAERAFGGVVVRLPAAADGRGRSGS